MAALPDPELTAAETVASDPHRSLIQPHPSSSPIVSNASAAEDEGRFVPGTLLNGRYRISSLLGRGGMGEVYRATDLTLGQSVALKFLPEAVSGDMRFLERFHGEVRVARQVSHPNVCRVHDIGQVDGVPFISMEYVDGEDLSSLLQRIGKLPYDKCIEIARKICAGLAAAHSKGVIHRDLKPQNIMLNKRGEVVIMDFGLAAIADSLSGPEARNGTPAYMAPEQLKGFEVTARSDIYALGVVLFELFAGRRPFAAQTVQSMIDQQEGMQIAEVEDAPTAVLPILRRCLSADPMKRPVSPLAVAAGLPGGDALAIALAAGETPSPEMVAAASLSDGLPRNWAIACLAMLVLCAAVSPFLRANRLAFMQAPMRFAPPVLEAKSREAAAALGFTREPEDRYSYLYNRPVYLSYVRKIRGSGGVRTPAEWMRGEPGIAMLYREAPELLLGWPMGYVTNSNPAPMKPGMAEVQMDTEGRLRGFAGVPYRAYEGTAIEPAAVFRAAGLDLGKFNEIPPVSAPETATDAIRAWRGLHPTLPDVPVTIEIGWWKSQVTWVRIDFPWSAQGSSGGNNAPAAFLTLRSAVMILLIVASGLFSILMAKRNWKLGRVDKKGAARLAMLQIILGAVKWATTVHPVPSSSMLDFLLNAIGDWLFPAAVLWILYLALEPSVRARWPQSIVSWNRLLAGNWQDPLVAGHLLTGMALATILWTIVSLILNADPGLDLTNIVGLNGTRAWLAIFPHTISEGIRVGLIGFFVLFGLRRILRKDWIAAIAAAMIFATLEGNVANAENWQLRYLLYVCLHTCLIFVVLRIGLVAAVAWIVFVNLYGHALVGTDWSSWYMSPGVAMMGVLLATAALAFWKSLGSRDLLDDAPLMGVETSYPRS